MPENEEEIGWSRTGQEEVDSRPASVYDPPPAQRYYGPIIIGIVIFAGLIVFVFLKTGS